MIAILYLIILCHDIYLALLKYNIYHKKMEAIIGYFYIQIFERLQNRSSIM